MIWTEGKIGQRRYFKVEGLYRFHKRGRREQNNQGLRWAKAQEGLLLAFFATQWNSKTAVNHPSPPPPHTYIKAAIVIDRSPLLQFLVFLTLEANIRKIIKNGEEHMLTQFPVWTEAYRYTPVESPRLTATLPWQREVIKEANAATSGPHTCHYCRISLTVLPFLYQSVVEYHW